MLGVILGLICFAAVIYCCVKMYTAMTWHSLSKGERVARAEYARIQREQPDSAEARMSEPEFVTQFVASKPGMARYIIGGLLVVIIGLPASCVLGISSSLH